MVDLRGLKEWWHFREKGDLNPLLAVLQAGAVAPVVQQIIANGLRRKQPGTHYLAVEYHPGDYGRAGRLFEAGQQISEWTREYNKQDAAIAQALEASLISNATQGKEAARIYREEIERRAQEDREENE
jgi:hypothetical protein